MASDAPLDVVRQVTESLRWYLDALQASGVTELPADPRLLEQGASPLSTQRLQVQTIDEGTRSAPLQAPKQEKQGVRTRPAQPVAHEEVPMATAPTKDLFSSATLDKVQTLEALRAEIGDCRRCKLCQGRNNIVFGVGDPHAELMFVGEGPGRDEDLKGEPFVGRAGQLLTEIITKGMKMQRDEVYIANVVKCRPPDNRNPEPDEIAACQPFLMKQVELVKPKIIVALGTFAAQTLLQSKTAISRLRGVWHSYQGVKLMPTLHPAYLLRNPNDKKLVWQDIQAVLRDMGRL